MKSNATSIIALPRANYHANFTKHINYLFTLLLLLDIHNWTTPDSITSAHSASTLSSFRLTICQVGSFQSRVFMLCRNTSERANPQKDESWKAIAHLAPFHFLAPSVVQIVLLHKLHFQ